MKNYVYVVDNEGQHHLDIWWNYYFSFPNKDIDAYLYDRQVRKHLKENYNGRFGKHRLVFDNKSDADRWYQDWVANDSWKLENLRRQSDEAS
jgi:hypothetical protein